MTNNTEEKVCGGRFRRLNNVNWPQNSAILVRRWASKNVSLFRNVQDGLGATESHLARGKVKNACKLPRLSPLINGAMFDYGEMLGHVK
jgi:hypothetical protein